MTQAGYELQGLCYSEDCLYVVEGRRTESGTYSLSLTVHSVQSGSGDIRRLDTLTGLGTGFWLDSQCPRVDRHSRQVFIPCRGSGVTIACLHYDRLLRERTLTCVWDAISVDVMSPDTVYVGDGYSVHVVSITDNRIISTLETPDTVRGERPNSLAVLGDSVMVGYGISDHTLVLYRHGSPAPVRVIHRPGGLGNVTAVSTDCRSNYVLTDYKTRSMLIIDAVGNLQHTVNIPDTDSDTDSRPVDCAVVNRQLWVGCQNGDIVIMSSQ